MSMWSESKTPDSFPVSFHQVWKSGNGVYTIHRGAERECKTLYNKWRAFKQCLRRNPRHQTTILTHGKNSRAVIGQDSDGTFYFLIRISTNIDPKRILEQALHGG